MTIAFAHVPAFPSLKSSVSQTVSSSPAGHQFWDMLISEKTVGAGDGVDGAEGGGDGDAVGESKTHVPFVPTPL